MTATSMGTDASGTVSGSMDQLAVPYDYAGVRAQVARRKGMVITRAAGMGLSLLVLAGLQIWRMNAHVASPIFSWPYWVAFGVSMGVSTVLLTLGIVAWRRARAAEASMTPEPALVIGRQGVRLAGSEIGWADIAGLAARTRSLGRGDEFCVSRLAGPPISIGFALLAVAPSTLDGAARAYSRGRHGVDFSTMDN